MAQTFEIVVTDAGEVGFFATDGTYQEGAENIAKLLQAMETNGASIDAVGQVEQHAHSPQMAELHAKAHE